MKKTTLITIILAVLGVVLVSCKSDISQPEISSNPSAPAALTVSAPGQFTQSYKDSTFKFSWSAADFGFKSSTSYTVQLSTTNDFTNNVADLVTTQNLNASVKAGDINTILITWKLPIGSNVTLYYRVGASVGSNVSTAYSAGKSTTLAPFSTDLPEIYVPGSYQGWAPGGDAYSKLFSYNFDSHYTSIVRLDDGVNATTQFKITNSPDWNHTNWGGTLTKSGTDYSGSLDPKGGNLEVNAACYQINVDVTALTISLTKTHDWGIIGSAVPPYDWSQDVNMFYDGKNKIWTITANFKAGEFKFRADNDWGLNYGDNGADGTLDAGGANIKLPADGNYTISFDPVALTYTIKKN